MNAHSAFDALLQSARVLMQQSPALGAFSGPLPEAQLTARAPQSAPVAQLLEQMFGALDLDTAHADFAQAVIDAAPYANWQRSYSTDEVGADFLARYGWFELLGPGGHFYAGTHRAYVGIWGRNLYYPWHNHEAEEIYYCAAGSALFEAEGAPPITLQTGETKIHHAHQPHAMTTADAPILTLVLWRGAGLDGKPQMVSP